MGTNSLTPKGGKMEFNAPTLASEIMQDFVFKTLRDTEEVLVYRDGVYHATGCGLY